MGRVQGKVALISGGARGMGASHARRLIAEGAQVVIGDLLDTEGEAMAATGEWRRVLQVLLNLLGNALRYAPEGSRVQVSVAAHGNRAVVTVADEGAGLSPQQQAKGGSLNWQEICGCRRWSRC